jgi:DnaJ-class molecular chaperone
MTCPKCHGTGTIRHWLSLMGGAMWMDTPCPECGGSGIASCCDAAGSATGDERPKCHPLLFTERTP